MVSISINVLVSIQSLLKQPIRNRIDIIPNISHNDPFVFIHSLSQLACGVHEGMQGLKMIRVLLALDDDVFVNESIVSAIGKACSVNRIRRHRLVFIIWIDGELMCFRAIVGPDNNIEDDVVDVSARELGI